MRRLLLCLSSLFLFVGLSYASCEIKVDGVCVDTMEIMSYKGIGSEPAVSPIGSARQYFDPISGKLKCSEDGNSYTDCVGGGSASINWDDPSAIAAVGEGSGWTKSGTNVHLYTATDNVGIGTTAPVSALQVVGTITGNLTGTASTATAVADADKGDVTISSGAWAVEDDSHAHTTTTISGLDISADTNLAGTANEITLTDDTLSLHSAITRDSEWNGLDFLVGTATGTLSGEIAVGTTPGGELGGTWASPTIDDGITLANVVLTTPNIGVSTATSVNKVTITAPASSATLTIADGKTLTATNTVNLNTMTDGKFCTYTASGTVINCTSDGGGSSQWTGTTSIYYNGSVAINTSSPPSYPLDIRKSGVTYKTDFTADNLYLGTATDDGIIFQTNSSNRMSIRNDGKVGIGTTLPDDLLEISNGSVRYKFGLDASNAYFGTRTDSGLIIQTNNTSRFTVTNSGNVGINTTVPVAKLDIVGAGTTSATSSLIIRDSAKSAKVTILDNGNVGIGSTAPRSALDVNGTVTASGYASTGNKILTQIYSTTLTEAATSVTISGLNGDADGVYKITVKIKNGYNGAAGYLLRPNNSSTGSTYGSQFNYCSSNSCTGGRVTTLSGFDFAYNGALNEFSITDMTLVATSGNARMATYSVSRQAYNTTITTNMGFGGIWSNTADNITSLVLIGDQANALGVGTTISISTWK